MLQSKIKNNFKGSRELPLVIIVNVSEKIKKNFESIKYLLWPSRLLFTQTKQNLKFLIKNKKNCRSFVGSVLAY